MWIAENQYRLEHNHELSDVVDMVKTAGFAIHWDVGNVKYLAPDILVNSTVDGYVLITQNPPALLWMQVTFGG